MSVSPAQAQVVLPQHTKPPVIAVDADSTRPQNVDPWLRALCIERGQPAVVRRKVGTRFVRSTQNWDTRGPQLTFDADQGNDHRAPRCPRGPQHRLAVGPNDAVSADPIRRSAQQTGSTSTFASGDAPCGTHCSEVVTCFLSEQCFLPVFIWERLRGPVHMRYILIAAKGRSAVHIVLREGGR